MMHTDVMYPYAQDIVTQGKLKVCKINTCANSAHMITKPVNVAKIELFSSLVGIAI
jgi:hypothetical protein